MGVLRQSLERENILSVERNGQLWFHESRRSHLWDRMLSEGERFEIGQPAYSALLAQYRDDMSSSIGLMVPIAHTARFARDSQAANPPLAKILDLTSAQLAVLASMIEIEIIPSVITIFDGRRRRAHSSTRTTSSAQIAGTHSPHFRS
ncbi:hypothetical protein GCM10020255_008930 [Rhodococcus baikonurensis]